MRGNNPEAAAVFREDQRLVVAAECIEQIIRIGGFRLADAVAE